jgi:hypothetical protein
VYRNGRRCAAAAVGRSDGDVFARLRDVLFDIRIDNQDHSARLLGEARSSARLAARQGR